MPVKCHYCETKTHDDNELECIRNFLTPDEALSVIDISADDVHVFSNNAMGMLIGCDWSLESIKDLFENRALYIERCDPNGYARAMKHGICVVEKNNQRWFIATNEDNLKTYEQQHCKEPA